MLDADKRRNLHGSGATITSAYTEQEIQAANEAHDRKYGFSQRFQHYTNVDRHPETHLGPISEVFNHPGRIT